MTAFYKYQGTGNDFIIIDDRDMSFHPDKATVMRLCDRRFGIGADGLILFRDDDEADFRMVYYNADGMQSSMCGNGGRCIARFARKVEAAGLSGRFIAIDGMHDYEITGQGTVRLKMIPVCSIEKQEEAMIMDTGSPHFVLPSEDIAEIDIVAEARAIRYSERFRQEGINVNFTEERDGQYFMRTYERGVEDETLSCGTGTVAVALAIAERRQLSEGPVEIQTPGGKLSVHFKRIDAGFSDIWLEGPAEEVYRGSISI